MQSIAGKANRCGQIAPLLVAAAAANICATQWQLVPSRTWQKD
jgi:hypothetical protein